MLIVLPICFLYFQSITFHNSQCTEGYIFIGGIQLSVTDIYIGIMHYLHRTTAQCRTYRTYTRPDKKHIRHIVRLYKENRENTKPISTHHNPYIIETCLWASQPGLLRRKLLQDLQRTYTPDFYNVAVKPIIFKLTKNS
jgi:hypothetical protein